MPYPQHPYFKMESYSSSNAAMNNLYNNNIVASSFSPFEMKLSSTTATKKVSFSSVAGRKSEQIVAGVDKNNINNNNNNNEESIEVVCSLQEEEKEKLEEVGDYLEMELTSDESEEEWSTDDDADDEEESENEEETEEELEAKRILSDAAKLKQLAVFFAHPEKPVEMDGLSCGRNVFAQPSWVTETDGLDEDEQEEREMILAEAKALKALATNFLHPERPLKVDSTACARNYFSQPWATMEQETFGSAEARAHAIAEAKALKKLAYQYQHPEARLQVDPAVYGRNYFVRASACEQEDEELIEEKYIILEDLKRLRQVAVDYYHPENKVGTDPSGTACGRNYFNRPSAESTEALSTTKERDCILADCAQLKKLAVTYMHPELPVVLEDPTAFGRNYYGRPSADEQDDDDQGEREQILKDMRALKRLAIDYRHPEKPLKVDPTCFGRCYFGRASAEDQEDDVYSDEREIILAEMEELKQAAVDFMHPERSVSIDPILCCRNYFGRASAEEQESTEQADERVRVLAEAKTLKKLAVDFAHPEHPLETTDPTACARSYFSRPSAPGDTFEEAEARDQVLEDAERLKKLAADFLHPETPLAISSTACARNYYSRASASEHWNAEDEQERAAIQADAGALKRFAEFYLHPEVRVKTADPYACGRNYFARHAAKGISEHISSTGHANEEEANYDDNSQHDGYGHFDMDEDIFQDMRQKIVLPGGTTHDAPKVQSSKISSDEEGELSRSPSSVMLFTGAYEDADHPPLPSMG